VGAHFLGATTFLVAAVVAVIAGFGALRLDRLLPASTRLTPDLPERSAS
jgi:hypothetical protein